MQAIVRRCKLGICSHAPQAPPLQCATINSELQSGWALLRTAESGLLVIPLLSLMLSSIFVVDGGPDRLHL